MRRTDYVVIARAIAAALAPDPEEPIDDDTLNFLRHSVYDSLALTFRAHDPIGFTREMHAEFRRITLGDLDPLA